MSDIDFRAIGNAAALFTRVADRETTIRSDGSVDRLRSMGENLSAAGDEARSMFTADGYERFHSAIPEGASRFTRAAYNTAGVAADVLDVLWRPVTIAKSLADVALHGLALAFSDDN